MGTTPNVAIPYPDPTDLVTNGAADMQAIADRLDAMLRPAMMRRAISAAQLPTIPNAAVTDLAWPTLLDSDGSITYQNAKEIRIDVAGRYDVVCSIRFAANATGRRAMTVYLTPNGGAVGAILDAEAAPGATALPTVQGLALGVDLGVGDVLRATAYQDSGAGRALVGDTGSNFFTVIRRPS